MLNRSDGYQYTVNAELTIGSSAGNITGAVTSRSARHQYDSMAAVKMANADAGTC
ncbi:hypothetical protein [Pantoea stewartii]|uniref:hypothetical protein n=1 Tax=Pantoea stewartii TaxID=66269 RepID=UPI0025A1EA4A|nr:hypothetical protein [Pantoea stewartii]